MKGEHGSLSVKLGDLIHLGVIYHKGVVGVKALTASIKDQGNVEKRMDRQFDNVMKNNQCQHHESKAKRSFPDSYHSQSDHCDHGHHDTL